MTWPALHRTWVQFGSPLVAFLGALNGYKTYVVSAGMVVLGVYQLSTGQVIAGVHTLFSALVAAGLRGAIAGSKS